MYCLAWVINLWCCASLTLHEGLRRRQDAGIKPEMVQAVVGSVVDGVGKQLDTALKKARELDQKKGTKEQKMGELEAEINEAALMMSEKLAGQKKEPAKEPAKGPVMEPIKDKYTPSPGSPDSLTPESKKAPMKEEYKPEDEPKEESFKAETKSSGNMSPKETKKFISEMHSDMEQMKKGRKRR
ncbi:hypothetical protein DSO57_1003837 [Entomophthora muscae]|uniref:Uncharacterized protein n=1 Tax=Entomophthora muscae TaxID=34485 RepID=A0ACC2UT77_9FUNG|nr:hypothetical protein DSO57_1003837 [Entomophthora muscae]